MRVVGDAPWVKIALVVGGVLAALALVEAFAAHFVPSFTPLKLTFRTTRGFGNCYRSNNPALPIDFTNPKQRETLQEIVPNGVVDFLRQQGVTRCVTYDVRRRRRGSHPERARQVAIVGDSFAFGEGVREEDTVGWALAESLSSVGFASFAQSGADIREVRLMVERALSDPRRPTDILYFYNLNDVALTPEMQKRDEALLARRREEADRPLNWLERASTFYRTTEARLLTVTTSQLVTRQTLDLYFDAVNTPALNETLGEISAMTQLAREHGVGFWFVVYPWMHSDWLGRYPFRSIHDLLIRACRGWTSAHCIDGLGAFAGAPLKSFVVDFAERHPNRVAHLKMAEFLRPQPGFPSSIGETTTAAPRSLEPVVPPATGLDHRTNQVSVDEVVAPPGEYPNIGPLLSVDVAAPSGGNYVVSLVGRAAACPERAPGEWPRVGIYLENRLAATLTLDSVEERRFTSTAFAVTTPATLRIVSTSQEDSIPCKGDLFIDHFDIVRATGVTE